MKINGIGTVAKETAMEILTQEGRDAVKSGEITTEEWARCTSCTWLKRQVGLAKMAIYSVLIIAESRKQ